MNEKFNIEESEYSKWIKENDPRKSYKVPEDYFNSFPDSMMSKINNEQIKPERTQAKRLQFVKISAAIAASLIILIASIFIFDLRSNDSGSGDFVFEEDATWNFLINNSTEFSLSDLAEMEGIETAIEDLEDELFAYNIPDEFIDDIDFSILEDIYE